MTRMRKKRILELLVCLPYYLKISYVTITLMFLVLLVNFFTPYFFNLCVVIIRAYVGRQINFKHAYITYM